MKRQIEITAASCGFRGQTVFRGDVVPGKDDKRPLTDDEVAIMVPRLAKSSDGSEDKAEDKAEAPTEAPTEEKAKPATKKPSTKKPAVKKAPENK